MSKEITKKMIFFTRIVTSIKDFDKYSMFALEKTTKAIAYLTLLILIFTIIITATFTYKFYTYINRGISYVNDNINEITYNDGILSVNSR